MGNYIEELEEMEKAVEQLKNEIYKILFISLAPLTLRWIMRVKIFWLKIKLFQLKRRLKGVDMNYVIEDIDHEKRMIKTLTSDALRNDQNTRELLERYDKSLDEIKRLVGLSGELYRLAVEYDLDAANRIVAKFARII